MIYSHLTLHLHLHLSHLADALIQSETSIHKLLGEGILSVKHMQLA
jgi:hypothetical protein